MKRIICIGNRLVPGDAAGPGVYDRLSRDRLPANTELVDGGLGGLDLLRLVEGAEQVIFVDSVQGFAAPGEAVVVDLGGAAASAEAAYGHGAGLSYLLRVLPEVCDGPMPRIALVGVESGPGEAGIEEAARLAVALAEGGGPPSVPGGVV